MKPRTARIKRFYDAVDQGDVEAIVSLFSPNIVYKRGSRIFRSIDAVRRFYESGRKLTIAGGTHRFATIIESDDVVTVSGTFDGSYADGTIGAVGFVDRFEFQNENVVRRVTTFPGREI